LGEEHPWIFLVKQVWLLKLELFEIVEPETAMV